MNPRLTLAASTLALLAAVAPAPANAATAPPDVRRAAQALDCWKPRPDSRPVGGDPGTGLSCYLLGRGPVIILRYEDPQKTLRILRHQLGKNDHDSYLVRKGRLFVEQTSFKEDAARYAHRRLGGRFIRISGTSDRVSRRSPGAQRHLRGLRS